MRLSRLPLTSRSKERFSRALSGSKGLKHPKQGRNVGSIAVGVL